MRLISTTYGNGRVESRGYVAGDNLVGSIQTPGVVGFSYTYDADKRKLTEANTLFPAESQVFAYDNESRLTGWRRAAIEVQSWALSPVGDWNATTRTGPDPTAELRTHNRVHEITAINGNPLSYDAKGNLTGSTDGAAYAWDVENRLAGALVSDASEGVTDTATYAYDALGRRVQKTVSTHPNLYDVSEPELLRGRALVSH
jgi:YD repeat-containing protein